VSSQIFGLLACIEGFVIALESRSSKYLHGVLEKQHNRLRVLLDRHVVSTLLVCQLDENLTLSFNFQNEQIQFVEQTKLTSKKRKGVAPFVRQFPSYVSRVEEQLTGAEGLDIRNLVDSAYEKIVNAMFESLKHMAKTEGEDEDKGQLNYHVIVIGLSSLQQGPLSLNHLNTENMHYFIAEIEKLELGTGSAFTKKAQATYEENLNAYVKIVLRRPFGKIIVSPSAAYGIRLIDIE
jgi:exocyst complex component 1